MERPGLPEIEWGRALLAVITDGLNRAAFHGFRAGGDFFVRLRLAADVGHALVIIAGEEVRSGFTAQIAVDAVAVNIELARDILFGFIVDIGHFVYGGYFSRHTFWLVFAKMQPFFIATRHFSRQNRRMQEQKASKATSVVARMGMGNIIWSGLLVILLLTAAGIWLRPYGDLATATWREADSTLPWEAEGLRVEKVRGYWESSEGNTRMALRAACYPVAEIELGEAQGSGMLYITFTDENTHQAGDTINLYYDKGQFRPRHELNIVAEGNKARVFVEAGYDRASEFELHQHDESSPLWRVNIFYRPEGSVDMRPVGSETIPARFEK